MNEEKEPLSDEMFLAATRFRGTIEAFVKALDDAGYWGDASLSISEKCQHVKHKFETTHMPVRSVDEIAEWIENNLPGCSALRMPEPATKILIEKAHAEQWHPELVGEALVRLAKESMNWGEAA